MLEVRNSFVCSSGRMCCFEVTKTFPCCCCPVIRGLALGTLNESTRAQFLTREIKMASALSMILSIAGFGRAILFKTAFPEAVAVTFALGMIVFSSICLGAILPILLEWLGVDPAHSSTTIQGMLGILPTCSQLFWKRFSHQASGKPKH